jgi:DUF4097 and DUF4098 domain-containing protein YvlB
MNRTLTLLTTLTVGVVLLSTPAWADYKMERRLALEPGGTFTLASDVGAVTVTGDSESGAIVTITSERDDFEELFDLRFEEAAGRASVAIKRRGGWLKSFRGGDWFNHTQLVVRVPSQASVDLKTSGGSIEASRLRGRTAINTSGGSLRVETVEGNVDGRTSGGSVRVRDVRGDVLASTSGGSIDITDVRGSLRATTSGGGINIETVSGDLYASTSGGGVEIGGAGGRVEAHSSGGPVTVRFASGNNRGGELSTSGGGVRTEVDPSVALSIDASSSGGSVTSDLPVTVQGRIERNSLHGDLNGGGALLRLRSSGGGVRISRTTTR